MNETINSAYNQTDKDYPKDKTIHQIFEEQVFDTPNNIALVFENKTLTYQELNERANQLARYIKKQYQQLTNQELKPDTLLDLCLDRSLDMVVAILAVLKAGGAYIPIDPNYPRARINFVINDTNSRVVITQKHLLGHLSAIDNFAKIHAIVIDDEILQRDLQNISCDNLEPTSTATDLAYIIYTSGTTGTPKGVMIEHHQAINGILPLYSVYDLNKGKVIAAFASYAFDVSIVEFFVALFGGATLHILSNTTKSNPELLSKYIEEHNVNYIYLPPALLAIFPRIKYKSLCGIIYAGEPCDRKTAKYWSKVVKLYNYYGTTETTLYSTGMQIVDAEDTSLIGYPIANTSCYILDKNLSLTREDEIGELYIGGAGVARGYLNRPELTKERFITNPFATKYYIRNGYTRMYKTGDLIRRLGNGKMEYIGRNDFQVKVRGFRIELGEIENTIANLEGIKQVTVQLLNKKTKAAKSKSLVAYYTLEANFDKTQDDLVNHLQKNLPDYMVPSFFVKLETMPLTVNGKLDRSALPEPVITPQNISHIPSQTVSKLEAKICSIWQKTLNLKQVGIEDNFYNLGGDSITATQIANKMSKILNKYIPVASIFIHKTIKNLLESVCDTETKNDYEEE